MHNWRSDNIFQFQKGVFICLKVIRLFPVCSEIVIKCFHYIEKALKTLYIFIYITESLIIFFNSKNTSQYAKRCLSSFESISDFPVISYIIILHFHCNEKVFKHFYIFIYIIESLIIIWHSKNTQKIV